MYGTQTASEKWRQGAVFENDVKMYGTQTVILTFRTTTLFENDVKMYGTQTTHFIHEVDFGLRMM